ncbi:MAG: aminopeptidase, partial [Sphaerochaetaceae bacterium]|nr:aminopeptidase [Sphaerochaetaceae bacterium]
MDKDTLIKGYMNFLDNGKTERRCVISVIEMAKACGFRDIETVDTLKSGDKVYVNKMGKSIMLFKIGSEDISKGMNILGAHIDSPRLDAKQNPIYEKDGIVYLNTHYYGGIKKYQWLALPLALNGFVFLSDGTKIDVNIGDDPEDPVFCISDILPHIAQEQMKKPASEFVNAENLDVIIGCSNKDDVVEDKEENPAKNKVLKLLKDKYGFEEKDFISAEIEIVPAGKTRYSGIDKSLILGYGHDDRVCAYSSVMALLEDNNSKRTLCCILSDKEEVSSAGATGMNSHLLDNAVAEVVARLCNCPNQELIIRRALRNSYMLSSDV